MTSPVANPVEPDPKAVPDSGLPIADRGSPIADSPRGPACRRTPCDTTRRGAWSRPSPGAGSVGTPPPPWTGRP